jgi:hypothetical protein
MSGNWDVIYETTLNNDVSYIDITGLDINTDKEYYLSIITKHNDANQKIYLYVENDFSDSNYKTQGLYAVGTSITPVNENNPVVIIGSSNPNDGAYAKINITKDPLGYARYLTLSQYENLYYYALACVNTNSKTNITTLRIKASVLLRTGTYILLCRPR